MPTQEIVISSTLLIEILKKLYDIPIYSDETLYLQFVQLENDIDEKIAKLNIPHIDWNQLVPIDLDSIIEKMAAFCKKYIPDNVFNKITNNVNWENVNLEEIQTLVHQKRGGALNIQTLITNEPVNYIIIGGKDETMWGDQILFYFEYDPKKNENRKEFEQLYRNMDQCDVESKHVLDTFVEKIFPIWANNDKTFTNITKKEQNELDNKSEEYNTKIDDIKEKTKLSLEIKGNIYIFNYSNGTAGNVSGAYPATIECDFVNNHIEKIHIDNDDDPEVNDLLLYLLNCSMREQSVKSLPMFDILTSLLRKSRQDIVKEGFKKLLQKETLTPEIRNLLLCFTNKKDIERNKKINAARAKLVESAPQKQPAQEQPALDENLRETLFEKLNNDVQGPIWIIKNNGAPKDKKPIFKIFERQSANHPKYTYSKNKSLLMDSVEDKYVDFFDVNAKSIDISDLTRQLQNYFHLIEGNIENILTFNSSNAEQNLEDKERRNANNKNTIGNYVSALTQFDNNNPNAKAESKQNKIALFKPFVAGLLVGIIFLILYYSGGIKLIKTVDDVLLQFLKVFILMIGGEIESTTFLGGSFEIVQLLTTYIGNITSTVNTVSETLGGLANNITSAVAGENAGEAVGGAVEGGIKMAAGFAMGTVALSKEGDVVFKMFGTLVGFYGAIVAIALFIYSAIYPIFSSALESLIAYVFEIYYYLIERNNRSEKYTAKLSAIYTQNDYEKIKKLAEYAENKNESKFKALLPGGFSNKKLRQSKKMKKETKKQKKRKNKTNKMKGGNIMKGGNKMKMLLLLQIKKLIIKMLEDLVKPNGIDVDYSSGFIVPIIRTL